MSNVVKEISKKEGAIKYISEEKQKNPNKSIKKIIAEACFKFDLSPKEEQFIHNNFSS